MERIDDIFKKMAWFYRIFTIIAVAVVCKVVYLQFINPTEIKAGDIAYKEEEIEAIRGDILARDGRPMATSVPYYQIRMDCTVSNQDTFNKYIDALSQSLASFYKNKKASDYKKELVKARKEGKRYKAIGNGWTVDVIAHILTKLKDM